MHDETLYKRMSKHSVPSINDAKDGMMGIFDQFRVGQGHYLPIQSLLGVTSDWPPELRQQRDAALASLVEDGMIEYMDGLGYRLLFRRA